MTNTQGRILIVDDEPTVVYTLKCILEQVGYTVHEAETVKQVTAILNQHTVDVILCDLGLTGGESGLDVLKKADEIQPGMGQVLLTGYAEQETIEDLEAKGIAVFMKPVETSRLLQELRQIIEQKAA